MTAVGDARKRQSPVTSSFTFEPPVRLISANERLHFHVKARLTQAWRSLACACAYARPHYDHAHITVSIRFPTNHRRDVGNYYPTAKAIVDGLVDAGVLDDDDDSRVIGPDLRRERPNGPLRVTVHIEPLEGL